MQKLGVIGGGGSLASALVYETIVLDTLHLYLEIPAKILGEIL